MSIKLTEPILTARGTPFADARTAEAAITRKGIKETHEVVPSKTSAGFIIMPIGQAKKAEKKAEDKSIEKGTTPPVDIVDEPDPNPKPIKQAEPVIGQAAPSDDELMEELFDEIDQANAEDQNFDPEPPGETYFICQFAEKRGNDEDETVFGAVNGKKLMIQRGKRVPLPKRFIVMFKQAKEKIFSNKQGELGKVIGYRECYPLQVIKPCTKQEFIDFHAEGTTINQKAQESLTAAQLRDQAETMGRI